MNSNDGNTANKRMEQVVAPCVVAATAAIEALQAEEDEALFGDNTGTRLGAKTRKRKRIDLLAFFESLGPDVFRRMYRMDQSTFMKLNCMLEPHMRRIKLRRNGGTPNGDIPKMHRLSMALRWFAGGDKFDIAALHGVHPSAVLISVWRTVDAIHGCTALNIKFPDTHEQQQEIADGFKELSAADLDNCVGNINCFPGWTNKPTESLEDLGLGHGKFYCGRKKKFGLNVQVTSDHKRRFIDVDVSAPGSASDFFVWLECGLRKDVETDGYLKPGLCLYGDNAYVNTPYMMTPFKGATSGPKDDYKQFLPFSSPD